jgi:Reverse transcriptase (RNA-dependent DNA polymerase)
MEDFTIMKFTGASVDILCEMKQKYKQFMIMENGTKAMYVRLVKAIYGCIQSALMWYQLFYLHLKEIGFKLNPYNPCVANKEINSKQCTIAWYVDDTKISHVDASIVTTIIEQLEQRFGKMTVNWGKEHVFLGMKIVYKVRTAEITMCDYLEEAIIESGLNVTRTAATPTCRDLFDIDEKGKPLKKREGKVFHSVVAKLLYVSIRVCQDVLLAISFLCTCISKSTTEDQAKLKRVLEYLKATLHYKYILGVGNMRKVQSWVDESYMVHLDMKSHTGGVMSFGIRGLTCKSGKQKLKTKSSTEAEVVGASDYLPNTMWTQMFLEEQGYKLDETIRARVQIAIKSLYLLTTAIWVGRNEVLHAHKQSEISRQQNIVDATFTLYHRDPDLLLHDDQHYCDISLERLLRSCASNKRQWLHRVKASRKKKASLLA